MSKAVAQINQIILTYLDKSGQSDLLPQVVEELKKKVAKQTTKSTVIVSSAIALDAGELKLINNFVTSQVGKRPIKPVINKELIAGFTVRIDDTVYDASLISRLNTLAHKLSTQGD